MQPDRLQPILDVAVARFEQERALREELRDAQTKLVERKVIERAKGILMKQKGVGEEEAYRLMRKLAMDRNAQAARRRAADHRRRGAARLNACDVCVRWCERRSIAHADGAVQHPRCAVETPSVDAIRSSVQWFSVGASRWHGSR